MRADRLQTNTYPISHRPARAALCLLLGALGIAGMWAAIFADVGVMVIAVLNATRALYTKDLTKN